MQSIQVTLSFIKRQIYDIEEELDKVKENFKSEYKGNAVYVKYLRQNYRGDKEIAFSEIHISPYGTVIEKDKIRPIREYGDIFKDSITHKFGLREVHSKKELYPAKYDTLYKIRGLTYVMREQNQYGLLSDEGNIIIQCLYDSIYAYNDDNLIVVNKDGKMGVINEANKWIVPNDYDAIIRSYRPHYFYLKRGNGEKGYLNIDSIKKGVYKAGKFWGAYNINEGKITESLNYNLKDLMKKTNNYDYYQMPN